LTTKPLAVMRRDIIASTGPAVYGINRMDKVKSPQGEMFTFLGVCDGVAYLERDDKTKGQPIEEIDTEVFARWRKVS